MLLAYNLCPAQLHHKHDGKGTHMLVDTGVVCPNPCLSNEIAARTVRTQMGQSFWHRLLGAGTDTVALAPLLMFPLCPLGHHLPHTWENTDLQVHLWEQTHQHK